MSVPSGTGAPADRGTPAEAQWWTSRRRLLVAVGGLLLVAALVIVGVLVTHGDDGSTAAPTRASSSSAESTPAGDPAVPSEEPTGTPLVPGQDPAAPGADDLPSALPAVALDQVVAVEGMIASLARIEQVQGQATGPGDVAGPALRVTVRIVNESGADVSMGGVSVNLAYGPDLSPGPPLDDPSRVPFVGILAPGEVAEGVYVFRVPTDARDDVTVEVGYRADAPRVIFSGPVR